MFSRCKVWQVSDISKGRGNTTYSTHAWWSNNFQVTLCSWAYPHNTDTLIVHHSFCNFLHKLPTSHFEEKWRLKKKDRKPVSEFVTYILTQSFSHVSHWSRSRFFVPNRLRYDIAISSDRTLHTATTHVATPLEQQNLTSFPISFSTVTSSFSTVMTWVICRVHLRVRGFTISRRFGGLWLPSSLSQRLPKHLKFVSLLASVYEPQSCQNYLASHSGLLKEWEELWTNCTHLHCTNAHYLATVVANEQDKSLAPLIQNVCCNIYPLVTMVT